MAGLGSEQQAPPLLIILISPLIFNLQYLSSTISFSPLLYSQIYSLLKSISFFHFKRAPHLSTSLFPSSITKKIVIFNNFIVDQCPSLTNEICFKLTAYKWLIFQSHSPHISNQPQQSEYCTFTPQTLPQEMINVCNGCCTTKMSESNSVVDQKTVKNGQVFDGELTGLSINSIQNMNYSKLQKYAPSVQLRQKFKKQCLKGKNILFQSQQLQIGCKILPLYDFYTSTSYLQINLFIGNKTNRPLQSFKLDFKGTPNLQLYIQQKNRNVKEHTQYKERIIIGCTNYEQEILLIMDMESQLATLKGTVIPITLFNFYNFNAGESLPQSIATQNDLQTFLGHKYQFIENSDISVNASLFKKGMAVELQKYMACLVKICEGVYIGHFSIQTLINQYTLIFKIVTDKIIKVQLFSNQYHLFDQIFNNLKFLFE